MIPFLRSTHQGSEHHETVNCRSRQHYADRLLVAERARGIADPTGSDGTGERREVFNLIPNGIEGMSLLRRSASFVFAKVASI